MAKRHTNQNHKQANGQYYTENASVLLKPYTRYIVGKDVIDPFAGKWDLLDYALANGAKSVKGYDIEPRHITTEQRDSIINPPDFNDVFLLTNPPYLSKNKNKNKIPYEKWKQSDLYKCHVSSFSGEVDEGILILPSNFLSESSAAVRDIFFSHYRIVEGDYYYYKIFPNVTTGIVTFYFNRSHKGPATFRIHYPNKIVTEQVTLKKKYGWLWGDEFFDYIDVAPLKLEKWTGKEKGYLTNIVLGLLDNGKWQQGLTYNEGNPIICDVKAFTTYQIVAPFDITEKQQRNIVVRFNERLTYYRQKYHGMFLSNYMGAEQKILARSYVNKLFTKEYISLVGDVKGLKKQNMTILSFV